jgi:serine/threonine-protein kinase
LQSLADYYVLRPLGSGGMSSVYLARQHDTEHLCVIKTLASVEKLTDPQWHTEAARCLRQEAALLHQLDHPHIARVWEWVGNEQGGLLVLDYVPGLTLEQRLTRTDAQGNVLPGTPLPVDEVLRHGCTVAAILEYLARLPQPLVHHDIKPGNLILRDADGVLVLVDFGGAVLVPDSAAGTVRMESYGTPGYAAPEQYRGASSPQSDIYGLGATLYHLLTDDDPTSHPLEFPKLALLPTGVRTVLEPTLAHEPAARPNAQTLRIALQMLLRGSG